MLCTLTRFAGTVAFNINIFNTMALHTRHLQDPVIWLRATITSVLFLASGRD